MTEAMFKLVAPPLTYWTLGLLWLLVDHLDLFPQYKLHTPEEFLKRNHVSFADVCKTLLRQQGLQVTLGLLRMPHMGQHDFVGKEDYDIAVWARRLRAAQRLLPGALAITGLDSVSIANRLSNSYPSLAGALRGGEYPWLTQTVLSDGFVHTVPAFSSWELRFGQLMYWVIVPIVQFVVAIVLMDLWQYIVHRWMHTNKWMYSMSHSPFFD
jgi:sphinganine C4-monooxygenase